jgi:RimJ/RimL family protein N-acetyltransferase
MQISIKKVSTKDSDFLLLLRNEKTARKNSLISKITNKKDHKKWLDKELNNNAALVLIAHKDSERIGIVRYNLKNILTYVSINLEKKFRNLGYGTTILKASEKYLKKSTIIVAKVKTANKNSLKFFKRNKFKIFSNEKHVTLIKILRK